MAWQKAAGDNLSQTALARLLGDREADSIPVKVVHGVVLPEEDITYENIQSVSFPSNCNEGRNSSRTNDPQIQTIGHIKTSERRHARALDFQNVVGTLEHVRRVVEVESEVRKVGNLGAVDGVLSVPALGRANLGVDHLGHVGRERNERGTCKCQFE